MGDCSYFLVCWPHTTLGETTSLETNLDADRSMPAQPGGQWGLPRLRREGEEVSESGWRAGAAPAPQAAHGPGGSVVLGAPRPMLPAILGAPQVPGSPASQWVLIAVLCLDVDSGTFPLALESVDPGGWSPSPPPTWPRPAWGVKGPACPRLRPAARGPPTWAWAGAVTLACGSSPAPPTPPWAAPGHEGVGLCLRHIHRWLQRPGGHGPAPTSRSGCVCLQVTENLSQSAIAVRKSVHAEVSGAACPLTVPMPTPHARLAPGGVRPHHLH